MLKIHFTCFSSSASRSLLVLLVSLLLASNTLSMVRTWDRQCIDNESFSSDTFIEQKNPQRINGYLIEAAVHRGSIIPSMIKMTIDSSVGTYNHSVEYCPWSDPMPLAPRRVPSNLSRDVCYTMKVGSHQIQNAFVMDINDPEKAVDNQKYREENLEEITDELKEFNFGNCLSDMNSLLFANYDQMLFTVNEFKYSLEDLSQKINLVTPQNFYFLREKLHGDLRQVVNKELHFAHEEDVTWHDVILFQMARAVNMIHLRGWVHRDIKNENFYVKKTVDKRIEVRLGEFLGSRMKSSHQRVETHIDDDTYGGPFYIPADAKNHPDDLGNDYYALGLAMIELITHRSVEDNMTSAIKNLNIASLDQSEVLVQDKVELQMELQFDPVLEGIDLTNIKKSQEIVEERREERIEERIELTNKSDSKDKVKANEPDLDFSLDSTSLFDVSSIDMNFLSIVTPGQDKHTSNYRILESSNRNLSNNGRILTKNSYGEFDVDTFLIDSPTYGELNFDPHANKETDTFVKKAEDDMTDLMVHQEFQILDKEISLPSVENVILDNQLIVAEQTVETKVFNSNLNVFKEDEMKVVQQATSTTAYNAQKEADALIKRMSSMNYYERFIDLRIFGNSNDPELVKAKQENVNMNALQFCYKEFEDYRKTSPQNLQYFKSGLTTTECLMIFIARSLLQSDNYKSESYNYFNLLDAGFNMNSMNDVFNMIAIDRNVTATHAAKMVSFTEYYQMYNRILI